MAIEHQVDTPLAQAVRAIGSQSKTARIIGKSQTAVYNKLKAKGPVWDTAVRTLEAVTGIPKHILRPDLFEAPSDAPIIPVPDGDFTSVGPSGSIVACDRAALSHRGDA